MLPLLQQLSVVDNRYPFDWSTVLQLQGLQVLQPGLRVDLGAPSSWCVTPSAVRGRLVNLGSTGLTNPPAGWTSASAAAEADSSGSSGDNSSSSGDNSSSSSRGDGSGPVEGGAEAEEGVSTASEDLCGVCLDAPNALFVNGCRHQLCIECYKQLVKAAAAAAAASRSSRRQQQQQQGGEAAAVGCAACPFCRAPMTGFKYSAWVQEEEEV